MSGISQALLESKGAIWLLFALEVIQLEDRLTHRLVAFYAVFGLAATDFARARRFVEEVCSTLTTDGLERY